MSSKIIYSVIDQASVSTSWNGQPTTLQVNDNISMPQTTAGTMILSATNQATQSNVGDLSITSGGGQPVFLKLQALENRPIIETKNWGANNLSLTNISANADTPILVQAVGPNLPGMTAKALVIGTPLTLVAGDVGQGKASPQYMQLIVQSTAATLGVVGFIGGPQDASGNNGYIVTVNDTQNTGPGGATPPAGYYATTTSNTYTYTFNWGSSLVFVANLSPSTAEDLTVTMRAL
jgi:hypothetical protein